MLQSWSKLLPQLFAENLEFSKQNVGILFGEMTIFFFRNRKLSSFLWTSVASPSGEKCVYLLNDECDIMSQYLLL